MPLRMIRRSVVVALAVLLASSVIFAEVSPSRADSPADIVILGGESAVSASVEAELKTCTTGTVTRQAGLNRFQTAAAISKAAFKSASHAYITTGLNFPDALAGGPPAAINGDPVLLVNNALPASTAAELSRLGVSSTTVLGGSAAVPSSVVASLNALVPTSRIAGSDRYATAAAIVQAKFARADTVYVATGLNFPDALAGVPAAAGDSAPILLVRPDSIPGATAAQLSRLKPDTIKILGGTAVVSTGVADSLNTYASTVTRLSGSDRYSTATAISKHAFPSGASTIFIATGTNYPDALAGGPAAGIDDAPILLVRPDSIPSSTKAEIQRITGTTCGAASSRIFVDGEHFPNGFTVPAGEVWEFDADADTKVTSSGNVIVLGTLRMRPSSGSVEHFLQFTGVDESKFVGGGMTHVDAPNDTGLWVEDAGVLDVSGTPVTPWSYEWEADWSSSDDIVAAPNEIGDYETFSQVNSAADVPQANGLGYGTELLNLTRNVRIEGTEGGKTHILIHAPNATTPQVIEYAAIRYVAPWIGGDTDATGRYGLHLHHNGYATDGTTVEGVVIRDAENHSFVPHASHGITMKQTIAFDVIDAAYWWDRSGDDVCGSVVGCNESFDIVYDSVVAARIGPPAVGEHTATAMFMGGGENLTITNSVVVGIYGSVGTNASAYGWPSADRGVWNWANNIAHNNKANGIFVWQNTGGDEDENHVIEGFTAYYNGKSGVEHGAYGNSYVYKNLTLLQNATSSQRGSLQFVEVQSHALGKPSATTGPGVTDTQEWNSIVTGGAKMMALFHGTEGDAVRFLFCDFSEILFEEGSNGEPGAYDFIECGLDFDDFDRGNIDPGTVVRVQDGNSAYTFTGKGSKVTISPFYDSGE